MAGRQAIEVHAYVPVDRRRALADGVDLPANVSGSALEGDLSGFTLLTESLARELGQQRGAEELARRLNVLYDGLIRAAHEYGGSVLGFSGDALTCWFDGDAGARAVTAAQAMQAWMGDEASGAGPLRLKVGVATGATRRFLAGDPEIQVFEGLAGALVDELTAAEHAAEPGDVVLAPSTLASLGDGVEVVPRERFGVLARAAVAAAPHRFAVLGAEPGPAELYRPWVHPAVYERLAAGQGDFLAELRPAVALFLRFGGLEFERDDGALAKLDAFVREVQAVLARYEGTLVQLTIGDKGSYLYAAFGAPVAHEDDARRALNAALDLRDLDVLPAGVSIGVAAGRLRAGAYGGVERRTYGVLGDAVNLSARLMQAAAPGEVLATRDVRDRTGATFAWEPLPDVAVKGRSEPVAIARLAGRAHGGDSQAGGARTQIVGREAELDALRGHVERAAAGEGRVVALVAEAGLGKSRLAEELLRETRARGIVDCRGDCPSFGVNGAYVVWRPVWERLLGVDPAAADDARREAVAAQLERAGLEQRLPLLAPLLGLELDDNELTASFDAKLRKTVLESTLAGWLTSTTHEPTLILLEDCHWIDALSEDLLAALARVVRTIPVLILVTQRRRDVADGGPLSAAGQPSFHELPLERLTDVEAEELIRLRLGGDPDPSVVRRIAERAEGNPFYVEELLSFLAERPPAPGEAPELPSSLQSLILSRIDRLAEPPRATLKVASTIGRTFASELVAAARPELGGEDDVRGSLGTLARHEFVLLEREAEHVYAFKHALTQEAAYSTITAAARAALHATIGRLLETRDAHLDLLAHHFGRSDDDERKRIYLLRAGDAARDRYANDAAIDYYRRALPLLEAKERDDALTKLGKTLELRGEWDEAVECYREARELSQSRGDGASAARADAAEGEVRRKQGRFAEATSLFDAARSALEREGDRAGVAEVLHFAGVLAAQQGENALARERFDESLALRRALGDRRAEAASLNGLAIVAEYGGDLDEAGRLFGAALEILEELGDRWAVAALTNNLGNTLLQQGDPAGARPLLEQAVALQREIGDPAMLANFLCNLGNSARDSGDAAAARAAYDEGLRHARAVGDLWLAAYLLEDLAVLLAEQGDAERALTLAAAAAALREQIGAPRPEAAQAEFQSRLAAARDALGAAASARADAAGAALAPDDAIAGALLAGTP